MSSLRPFALSIACALAGASNAFAVGVPATKLPETYAYGQIDPDQLAQADAASACVLSQEQIENRPISRPAEVLEVVPGLIATQHSGDGKANQYSLRGFNLDHGTDLSAAIDGVPNNLRTHAHGQGYNDLNGLVPELIDTIEYRKGPYYAEDGDFSSAGSVRIRCADRLDRPFYQFTLGGNGYTRALLAGSTDLASDRHLLLGVGVGTCDGPWDKSEGARRLSFVSGFGGGTSEDGYHAELLAYSNRRDSSDQIPQRAVESGLIDRFGQIDPDLFGDTSRYTLTGEVHCSLGAGHLLVNAYAVHYSLDLFANDITYFYDSQLADETSAVPDIHFHPVEPRQARLTLRGTF